MTALAIDPDAVAAARHALEISQAEMARRAGISVGYVGMIEMGQRNPSAPVLARIATVLGVNPDQLYN